MEYARDKHGTVDVAYLGQEGSVTVVDTKGAMKVIKPDNQQSIDLTDVCRNVSNFVSLFVS